MKSRGVQFPKGKIKDGFVRSITDFDSNVKKKIPNITYTKQFIDFFGDWLNNPQNASKVVDKDGKPLVVYHQTASDFTVFNTDNPLADLNDSETPNGIFFKTNDHYIG